MFSTSETPAGRAGRIAGLLLVLAAMTGCAMAGLGGSMHLNITGDEARKLVVEIDAGASDARVLEVDVNGETELGVGRATLERYAMHRARLGTTTATGYFLCYDPCRDPVAEYVVAYSPEQVFTSDGELALTFRIVAADGSSQELSRTITPEMLPALWQTPRIEARPSGS